MAKLTRKTQKIFAGSATSDQITEFGTAQDTPVYSTDLDILQANTAYNEGYASAVLSDEAPYLEDTNALHYIATKQLAYLFQEGIPEYDGATTYYIGSIVKKAGTFELYGSLTNDNTGNVLTNTTNWKFLCDLANIKNNYFEPVMVNQTIFSGVTSALTNAEYTLDFLPNDGGVYEVYLSGVINGNSSGSVAHEITTSLQTQATRIAWAYGSASGGSDGVVFTSNKKIIVNKAASGTSYLYCKAYRKVG